MNNEDLYRYAIYLESNYYKFEKIYVEKEYIMDEFMPDSIYGKEVNYVSFSFLKTISEKKKLKIMRISPIYINNNELEVYINFFSVFYKRRKLNYTILACHRYIFSFDNNLRAVVFKKADRLF